jgi:tetratricopeptide (TPR) repeat protein
MFNNLKNSKLSYLTFLIKNHLFIYSIPFFVLCTGGYCAAEDAIVAASSVDTLTQLHHQSTQIGPPINQIEILINQSDIILTEAYARFSPATAPYEEAIDNYKQNRYCIRQSIEGFNQTAKALAEATHSYCETGQLLENYYIDLQTCRQNALEAIDVLNQYEKEAMVGQDLGQSYIIAEETRKQAELGFEQAELDFISAAERNEENDRVLSRAKIAYNKASASYTQSRDANRAAAQGFYEAVIQLYNDRRVVINKK